MESIRINWGRVRTTEQASHDGRPLRVAASGQETRGGNGEQIDIPERADVASSPDLDGWPRNSCRVVGGGLLSDKRRLVAEVRAMEERFGDRAVLRYERKQLFWEYTVVESGRRFPIEVRYPRRYPYEPPRIISVLPLPRSPHQLLENELCWIDRVGGDWNPARDTAATCINAAHRWFACLLVYLTLGQWPKEANEDFMRVPS